MPDLVITPRFVIAESELHWSAARSSGPGGQNVNKVSSKVTLRWRPDSRPGFDESWRRRFIARHGSRINREGELVLHSDLTRDQSRNLAEARSRLSAWLLECQMPPKVRRATQPTLGSQKRRLEQKNQRSEKKRLRGSFRPDD